MQYVFKHENAPLYLLLHDIVLMMEITTSTGSENPALLSLAW
jgi:hypothetical protein